MAWPIRGRRRTTGAGRRTLLVEENLDAQQVRGGEARGDFQGGVASGQRFIEAAGLAEQRRPA